MTMWTQKCTIVLDIFKAQVIKSLHGTVELCFNFEKIEQDMLLLDAKTQLERDYEGLRFYLCLC